MKNIPTHIALLLTASLMVISCTNNDYDLSNVDTTIGLGADTLTIFGNNSTENIKLDEVFKLGNSNFVKIAANGDYMLSISDGNESTSNVTVDRFTVNVNTTKNSDIVLDLQNFANSKGYGKLSAQQSTTQEVTEFEYETDNVPKEIEGLSYVGTEATLRLTLAFDQNMKNAVTNIAQIVISFPKYFTISKVIEGTTTCSVSSDNTITLKNVKPSNGSLVLTTTFSGAKTNENTSDNVVTFTPHTLFQLKGKIYAQLYINSTDLSLGTITPPYSTTISSNCQLSNVTISSATGKFNLTFDYNNLGKVTLNNIPNFLTDQSVCLNLYDPRINLTYTNNMPMKGDISGTLVSYNANGLPLSSVVIPSFPLAAESSSVVSIRKQNTTLQDTTLVVVPTLSDIIKKIPNSIEFTNIKAVSDKSVTSTILLGKSYAMSTKYEIEAPLSFDENASIVYSDTLNNLNDDIKKVSFKEKTVNGQTVIDGYLKIEADILNRVPAYLTLNAYGIDLNGDSISTDLLNFNVDTTIAASADGKTAVTTHLTIIAKPSTNSVFKTLDKIRFHLIGSASDKNGQNPIAGLTLNAYNQTLTIKNLIITKVGKVVVDLN